MANFFTRAIDWVTPWDRKGEVQRRQQKKKKDEEEQRIRNRAVRANRSVETEPDTLDQPLQVKKPVNVFDVNKNLTLGQNQPGIVPVFNKPTLPAPPPKPGTVIKPKTGNEQKKAELERIQTSFAAGKINQNQRNEQAQRALGTQPIKKPNVVREVAREIALTPKKLQVDLPIWVAKQAVRGVDETVRTGLEYGAQGIYGKENVKPGTFSQGKGKIFGNGKGSVSKFLYGDEPVKTYQQQAPEFAGSLREGGFKKTANVVEKSGAPILLGLGLLDLVTGGGKKKAAEEVIGEGSETLVKKGLLDKLLNVFRKVPNETGEIPIGKRPPRRSPTVINDLLSDADIADIQKPPTNIPVRDVRDIRVREVEGDNLDIPVTVKTPPKPIIRDFAGDATKPGRMPTPEEIQIRRFGEQAPGRPDRRIEGVTPRQGESPFILDEAVVARNQDQVIDDYAAMLRDVGEGNGTQLIPDGANGYIRTSNNFRDPSLGKGRMNKAAWREEAERQLRAGKADSGTQKAFNDAADPEVQDLLVRGERPNAPLGQPIKVKQVTDIPVTDNTVVPQGLPETPGTVRVTNATEPMAAKSEVVAKTPAPLPKEVQEVLDNPKQFTKRQVAAARNQRKLARQMAKTQEDTAEALARIESASPTTRIEGQPEGFAPTGKFRQGKKGNVSESASRVTEAEAGAKEMANRSTDDLLDEVVTKKSLTPGDRRRISAAKENLKKADPNAATSDKYRLLDRLEKAGRSDLARGLALIPRTIRKSASADTLTARTISKIDNALTDGTKLSDADYKAIETANTKFTTARDTARQAEEQYKLTHSAADLDAVKKARKAETDADLAAKTTEVDTARRVLKGSKEENAAKVVDDLEKEAELNMMDYVTANQLSGPATGVRNLAGTELAGIENRVGANLRAKIVKGITGENVGGFDRSGAWAGRKEGFNKMVGDIKRRSNYAGGNVMKQSQNFGTTINQAGETSLYSTTQSRLKAYYKNQLKDQGLTGERLKNDAEFMRMTDPDDMGQIFMDTAMKSSGLTGIYKNTQKIESALSKGLADWLGKALPPNAANSLAKGMVRIGFGYPTATANFFVQSGKRLMLGLPSAAESGVRALKGDKQGAALALDRALKEAGSGLAALTVGTALASADRVSGFYPEDKDERQRWIDEGKSELSIKIGDTWQPIPQGFGMFGLPLIVAAQNQEGGPEAVVDMFTDRKKISKLFPTDQAYGFLQLVAGDSTTNQDKNFVASTIRSFIPAGSFLNQTAKGLDETANDTTTRSFWRNVYDQVISGIPIANNQSDIPDKLSSTGEPIQNPNLLQTYGGARSVGQKAGIENSEKVDAEINSQVEKIDKYGLLKDENLDGVLEGSALDAFKKANSGQQLDKSEVKALKEGLVKGVSQTGTDTPYLEREQYDTNLAVLKMKRDLMEADKTVKPSNLEKIDIAIKKGEVYRDNQIPYDLIKGYHDTSLTEWRNMGDPEDDDYDPEMYETLWKMDELMTKNEVSDNYKGKMNEPKYAAKSSGKGKGRGGGRGGRGGARKIDTDFGTLKDGSFAPRLKEYDSIDSQSGAVPVIRRTRPNIVHKISSSG